MRDRQHTRGQIDPSESVGLFTRFNNRDSHICIRQFQVVFVYNATMLREYIHEEPAWEIAKLFPPQGAWTIDDYLEVEGRKNNRLIEFSNGQIEVLPMPSLQHQRVSRILFHLLFMFVQQFQLGEVFYAPTKVKLWDRKIREPDILFVANEHIHLSTAQWLEKIDLAMEIVSPDDPNRDLERKRREYAQAGIPEYWIIDPRSEEVMVLTLNGDKYAVHGVFSTNEIATSVLLEGFSAEVSQIFPVATKS